MMKISLSWYSVDHNSGNVSFLGERTISRWYTMYGTIIQSRDWLPDEVGGVVWLAQDNAATSVYIPVYCSVTDLPKAYKTSGRKNIQTKMFEDQANVEKKMVEMIKHGKRNAAVKELTKYTNNKGEMVVEKAISLGDYLWTKYDEKF